MKKTICLLLAVVLLSALFVSCKNDEESTPAVSNTVSGGGDSTLFEGLRDWDGEGAEFLFLVPGMEYTRYQSLEIGAEELNNEVINDAVYERNALV